MLVPVLALAALVAASDTAPASPGVAVDSLAEYVGFYRWGFEHSEFIACGVARDDRPWWVVPTAVALAQRDSLVARLDSTRSTQGPVLARVRGIVGRRVPMGAGHMGASTRYFRVQEVLEITPADGASCPLHA